MELKLINALIKVYEDKLKELEVPRAILDIKDAQIRRVEKFKYEEFITHLNEMKLFAK